MYINPYRNFGKDNIQLLKANFHTHAGTGPDTCGAYEIDDVFALYKEAGYNVLAISNHDICTDSSDYGIKHGMVTFNSFEYSQGPHMLCIDVDDVIYGRHQEVIDRCAVHGGISILCHPNFLRKEYWSWNDVDLLHNYTGLEIYNGIIFRLSGSGLATDLWDNLLSQGKLVWGFGSDDFHRWYDLARAWNMILSGSGKRDDIKASIRNGSFYVSTGLILNNISMYDKTIFISANAKDTYVKSNKYIFIGKNGRILDEQIGEHGKYSISGDEPYIRMQVIGEHGAMLWTQPIYEGQFFEQ